MEDSIFTKIIKGEIPCHKIYEDEKTIAFMDIHPVQQGMVLVVPKVQVDHFIDLTPDDYQALMATVHKVSLRLHEAFPDKRIGVQIEGFDVPHTHVKLIPVASSDEFIARADMNKDPDHVALALVAEKLRF